MDPYDFPVTRSPRKELQGPRPPALKVRKDSHKIKKPPIAPPPSHQQQNQQHQHQRQHQQQQQPRPPVIIYTVSPKVIHTNPSDFMNLVQRLTGSSSSSSSSTSTSYSNSNTSAYSSSNPFNDYTGAISPAARLATLEKAKSPKENTKQQLQPSGDQTIGLIHEIEMNQIERPSSGNLFPGILSPGPSSLPPISPNFFSPPSDQNMLSFLHDLSPVLHSNNRNFLEGIFMPSPSTNFVSPRLMASPTPSSMDLFNNFNNIFDY